MSRAPAPTCHTTTVAVLQSQRSTPMFWNERFGNVQDGAHAWNDRSGEWLGSQPILLKLKRR
jgi:hypothetical protein